MGLSIKMTFDREKVVSALFTFPPAQLMHNVNYRYGVICTTLYYLLLIVFITYHFGAQESNWTHLYVYPRWYTGLLLY